VTWILKQTTLVQEWRVSSSATALSADKFTIFFPSSYLVKMWQPRLQ